MSSRSLRATAVRRFAASFVLCGLIGTTVPLAGIAATDKTLERIKGNVGYSATKDGSPKPISGQLVLPDANYAITGANSLGRVQLPDSSTIDIGQNTNVQVSAFSPAESGRLNTITLNNGALKFNVHHPAGAKSNYQFTTPTSQIAVRGTIGLLAAGPQGTMISCVACAAGDVTVTTGGTTTALVTGQTLTVTASGGVVSGSSVASNASVNNPSFNQVNGGSNPLGGAGNPPTDPTGASGGGGASGAGSAAGTGGAAGAGAGAGTAVAAAAAGTGAVVAATSNQNKQASPSPTPVVTPTPTPVVTPTPTPVVTPTPTPVATPTPTPLPPSPPTATMNVQVGTTGTLALSDNVSVSWSIVFDTCQPTYSNDSLSPLVGASTTLSVQAKAVNTAACTIKISNGAGNISTISVNTYSVSIGVQGVKKTPPGPSTPTTPPPAGRPPAPGLPPSPPSPAHPGRPEPGRPQPPVSWLDVVVALLRTGVQELGELRT